jgi:hypothetical protein
LAFTDSLVATVVQPTSPSFTVAVETSSSINCSASNQKDFNYFIKDTLELTIPACVANPSSLQN